MKKVAELKSNYKQDISNIVEFLRDNGFIVVDDDETEENYKLYHVLKDE